MRRTRSASGRCAIDLIGRRAGERVLAALQPEQHADRARRHDGADRHAGGDRLVGVAEQVAPHRRPRMALRQREHAGPAARLHDAADHGEFGLRIGRPFRDDLEEAGAGIAHAHRDAGQLVFLRAQRRRGIALQGLVAEAARGGEAERAGAHRIGGDLAHLRDVGLVGVLQRDRALAHDEDAHRGVRQQRAEVDVAVAALQRGEVFGERFPLPLQAFVHDRAGDVLDAFHQLDQLLAVGRLARREADAAIAHHHGGDAVPATTASCGCPTSPGRHSACGCRRSPA